MSVDLQAPDQPQAKPVDPEAYALQTMLASLIQLGAATSQRARQTAIGMSEAGRICDRQLAYGTNQAPVSNLTDPVASLVGVGFHLAMEQLFNRLDAGSGRFVTELPVAFRGIPGKLDLYDRLHKTLFDWKTTTLAKLKRIRNDGPPQAYAVQLQLYAACLKALGEDVRWLALVYVPIDSTLEDIYVWRTQPDQAVAEAAAQRVAEVTMQHPAEAKATPSELCPWCSYHNPHTTDLNLACPGNTKE